MSKKILILEPTSTVQVFFAEKLKKTQVTVEAESNGVKFLWALFNSIPDAVFINAKIKSPKSTELVRFIKSIEKFKTLPVALYSMGDYEFEQFYMKDCGADSFIYFDQKNAVPKIQEVLELPGSGAMKTPVTNDIMKSSILELLLMMVKNLNEMQQVVAQLLSFVGECWEVPASSFFVVENNGPA